MEAMVTKVASVSTRFSKSLGVGTDPLRGREEPHWVTSCHPNAYQALDLTQKHQRSVVQPTLTVEVKRSLEDHAVIVRCSREQRHGGTELHVIW
jgi:hypothetical protein